MYGILSQKFNQICKVMDHTRSIPVLQYKRNHDNCFNIKYRKRKLFCLKVHRHTWNESDPLSLSERITM
jgi:hypothetical protein